MIEIIKDTQAEFIIDSDNNFVPEIVMLEGAVLVFHGKHGISKDPERDSRILESASRAVEAKRLRKGPDRPSSETMNTLVSPKL